MKQGLSVIAICLLIFSCNSQPSIEKTVDSTTKVVEEQRTITRDSVTYKSDSSKKIIDSAFSKLKDSIKKSR